jgi:hypothetical protein
MAPVTETFKACATVVATTFPTTTSAEQLAATISLVDFTIRSECFEKANANLQLTAMLGIKPENKSE